MRTKKQNLPNVMSKIESIRQNGGKLINKMIQIKIRFPHYSVSLLRQRSQNQHISFFIIERSSRLKKFSRNTSAGNSNLHLIRLCRTYINSLLDLKKEDLAKFMQ